MPDIRTPEGREELRRPDVRDWPTLRDNWDTALDGLDIAQEMAEVLRAAGHTSEEANTSSRHRCKFCRWFRRWDNWRKGEPAEGSPEERRR